MRKHVFATLGSALAVVGVLAFPHLARAADVVVTEEARTHFAAGVALLQDPKEPRYEEAYREFKTAYAASPSYKILGNLALCAMKIERDQEAIDAYTKYLAAAGPDLAPAEREQIQRDLLTLKAGVVQVTVSSEPAGATITDVRTPVQGPDVRNPYGNADAPMVLGLRRGHHVITARMPGYLDATWEFEASGATLPPHVFTMVKPAPAEREVVRERPVPTGAYVGGAISLGLALTGTIVGIKALQEHGQYTTLNDGNHVGDASSVRSTGEKLDILTDALFGGAIVAAGVTAYVVLTRPTVEHPFGERAAKARPFVPTRVAPTWGTRGGGATAVWEF